MAVAIIPARGGSKRIPRKNIRAFHGKPIISYSITAAVSSGLFDRVIVSTDDEEIAKISMAYGAECPFLRPSHLSDDTIGLQPVIAHELKALPVDDRDDVCVILATAPLLRGKDLLGSYKVLKKSSASFVVSTTSFAYPPQRALVQSSNGYVSMLHPENALVRSQDLANCCHDAGQFYWGVAEAWQRAENILDAETISYELPREIVQDIDTVDDWVFAELLYSAMQKD